MNSFTRCRQTALRPFILAASIAALFAPVANAVNLYWDTNGSGTAGSGAPTGTWGTSNFWNTDPLGLAAGAFQISTLVADNLFFSAGTTGTTGTVTVGTTQVANSITFDDNVALTLSGGTSITLGSGASVGSGIFVAAGDNAANTISTALILGATSETIQTAGTGVLTLSGGITGTSNLILNNNSTNAAGITIATGALNNTGSITVSGSGAGSVLISSVIGANVTAFNVTSGTVRLSGANTFSGDVSISGGALEMVGGTFTTTNPLGTKAAVYKQVTLTNNAIFRLVSGAYNDNVPTATNVGAGQVFVIGSGGGTFDVGSGATFTLDDGTGAGTAWTNSQLQGSGTLTKTGLGVLSLGNSTVSNAVFTGQILVSAGVLRTASLTTGVGFGATSANTVISSGAALDLGVSTSTSAEPVTISGVGAGALALYNGGAGNGTNAIYSSGATASSFAGPITLAAASTIGAGAAGTMTLSGGITGAFNLTVNNLNAGGTTLSTVTVNNAGAITNSGVGTGTATISAVIGSNVTGVTQNSLTSGLALSGANTFTTGVNIKAGTVTISGNAAALGAGTVLLGDTTGTAAATLNTGATALTFANSINVQSGSSGLKVLGHTGTAAAGYSGLVTLNTGLTIRSSNTGALTMGAGGINLNGNTLTIDNTSTGRVFTSGVVSGSGAVVVTGSSTGDYVPAGAHTYTGGTTINPGSFVAVSVGSVGPAGNPTSGPFGAGTTPLILAGGSIRSGTGSPFTIGNTVTISNDSTFYNVASAKTLTFSGPTTLVGSRSLTQLSTADVVFSGAIGSTGAGNLILSASSTGALVLSAANAYVGTTTINGGTLALTSTGSISNPSITAQTGGTLQLRGNNTIGGATTPVITIAGGPTPATSGGLSLADGAANTVTIDSATPATPALVIGSGAGSPANLTFEVSAAAGDQIVLGAGVQTTVNAGGGLIVVNTLNNAYDGSAKVLLSSPTTDLTTTAGALVLNTASGNWGGYNLSLATTANAVTLTGVATGNVAPTTAYFKGTFSGDWGVFGNGAANNTNFTTDPGGSTFANALVNATTDVHLYATGGTNLATTLTQSFTIKSLTMDGGALTAAVSIAGGGGTLTVTPASSSAGILSNSGAGALTISAPFVIGADQSWTNNSANAITFSGGVTGAGNVTLNGTGAVTMSDATAYVGDGNITNSGFGSSSVTLASGTLNLRANGDGTTNPQRLTYNTPLIVTGAATINADYQAAAGGNGKTLAFPTTSIGTVALSVTGASHGYTLGLGNVTLNSTAGGTSTIAASTSTIWVTMGDVTGAATAGNTNTLALGGIIGNANSAVTGVIGDGVGGGNVGLTTNTLAFWSLSGAASNTYTGPTLVSKSGTVAGAGLTLAKTGGAIAIPGNLTIGDGTAVQTHLYLAGDNQIATTGTVTFTGINSGWAYLHVQGRTQTINSVVETNPGFGVIETREGVGTFGTGSITFNVASGTQTYQGYFRDISTGTIDNTNSLALVKTGAGTLQFGAINSGTGSAGTTATSHNYSGGTSIQNGTLQLTTANALPAGGNGNVVLDGGATFAGTLDMNGTNQGITGLSGVTGAVLGRVVNSAVATTSTLTIGNGGATTTFAGQFLDNTGTGGVLAIAKAGTGTLTLSGINTSATGSTTITAGSLVVGASGNLPMGTVILNGGTLSVLSDSNTTFINAFTMNNAVSGINVDQAIGGSGTNGVVTIPGITRPLAPAAGTLNVTGGNGYTLSVGSLALPGGTGHDTILVPATVSMTITGNVTNQMSGFVTTNFDTLYLDGTSTGNAVQGNISDSPAGAFTPTLLGGYTRVIKRNISSWTLSGTGSTYTGITQVQAGTLFAGANGIIPANNLQGVNVTATGVGVTGTYDFNGFSQTLNTAGGTGTAIALGGSTTTSIPQVLGAGSTVTLNGGVTYTSTNNPLGGIIGVGSLNLGAGNRTFNVGLSTSAGTVALPDLAVSSNLSNGSLTKTGTGVLCLTGSLNLTSIFDTAGTICITGATTLNSTGVTMNGGTFDLGGTTQNGNNFTLTSGAIVNGTLTTTNFLKQGPGTLSLGNTNAVSTVTANQGLASVTSNPATYSTIALNFTAGGAPVANIFSNTATLALGGTANNLLGGGAVSVTGLASTANSQTFASTLVNGGASVLSVTAGAGGSAALALGTLTRNAGGTVDFILPAGTQSATNGVTIGGTPTAGTLLTQGGVAYGTVGGNDWAANSTDSANNIVGASVAGAAGASLYTAASSGATFTGDADITAAFAANSGSTVNSIRFNTGALTLTLAGVNTATTGGILFGSGITAASTITGGTIQPGNGELVIITNKPNIQNVISSVLADNGAAPTTVTFRGNPNGGTTGGIIAFNANNLYTGPTYITSGRAQVIAAVTTPFGVGANAIVYVNGNTDGQFLTNQNVIISNPFVILGTGFNENGTRRGVIRLDSGAASTPTLNGQITLLGDSTIGNNAAISGAGNSLISGNIVTSNAAGASSFALTKNMTGALHLTGTNSQTATVINGGILGVNADAALGVIGVDTASTAPVSFTGTATLKFNNSAPITLSPFRNINLNASVASIELANVAGTVTIPGVISGTGTLSSNYAPVGTHTNPTNLILSGVNTFTGNFSVSYGHVTITNSSSMGVGAKTIGLTNGTAGDPQLYLDPAIGATPLVPIDLPANMTFTTSNTSGPAMTATTGVIVNASGNNIIRGLITMTSGGGGTPIAVNAGSLTFTGNFTPNATGRLLLLRGDATGAISGVIANGTTVDLPVTRDFGTGTWTLSGANTYTGATTVSAGTIKLGNAAALGGLNTGLPIDDNGTTVAAGAALDLGGQSNVNEIIRIAGTGVGGTGALTNTGGAASIGTSLAGLKSSGTTGITVTGATSVALAGGGAGSGAAATASIGVTAASFAITSNTQTYSVAPTVTIAGGTGATATATLTGGLVTAITVTAPGTGFAAAPTVTFSAGTILVAGTAPTGAGNNTNFVLNNLVITSTGSGYTAPLTATLNNASGATLTANLAGVVMTADSSIGGTGDITLNGIVSESGGSRALTKVGTNTLTLANANTYSGVTAITGGILSIGASSHLGSAAATNTLSIDGGTLLDTGTAVNLGANRTVAIGAGGATVNVATSKDLTIPAAVSGAGNTLTKTGNGVLTLGGAQTYAILNANAGTTNVNGAFSGGTATVNANATTNFNASQTLAALNIAAGVEVTFGDGLSFAGGTEKFGAPALVPEPGSLGLLMVGALGVLSRRRRKVG